MNAPGSRWTRSGWYDGVRFDARYDSVLSARDEKLHAELRAKEMGGVCDQMAIPHHDCNTDHL